jgi:putative addiction module component (TIGR02574 family)
MSTSITLESVFAQAKSLPQEERLELAERLWESVPPSEEIDAEQLEEVFRRAEELRSGKVKAIPGEEAWKQVDELLGSRRHAS